LDDIGVNETYVLCLKSYFLGNVDIACHDTWEFESSRGRMEKPNKRMENFSQTSWYRAWRSNWVLPKMCSELNCYTKCSALYFGHSCKFFNSDHFESWLLV